MKNELNTFPAVTLGTLVYSGATTPGSVIVYAKAQARWSRVPIQEVHACAPWHETLWRFLKQHPNARWMACTLLVAMLCLGIGVCGLLTPRQHGPLVRASLLLAPSMDQVGRAPSSECHAKT